MEDLLKYFKGFRSNLLNAGIGGRGESLCPDCLEKNSFFLSLMNYVKKAGKDGDQEERG